jgi:hypothetical protein
MSGRFTLLPLYPNGKSLRYSLDRRLGGSQSRSGPYEEVTIVDPTGTRNHAAPQPVSKQYISRGIKPMKIKSSCWKSLISYIRHKYVKDF